MAEVRCTIFFQAKTFAWSESLWLSSPFSTLPGGATRAVRIVNARAKLLGVGAEVNEVRLSFSDPSRLSFVLPAGTYTTSYVPIIPPGLGGPNADESYSCIVVRLQDTGGHRKLIFLSGYPDVLVTTRTLQQSDIKLTPDWLANYDAWVAVLNDNAAWRALRPFGPGGNVRVPVIGIANQGGTPAGRIALTTSGASGASRGQRLRVTGFPHIYGAAQQLNGTWTVASVVNSGGDDTIVLMGTEGIDQVAYSKLGVVFVPSYQLYSVATAALEGATHHKRGVRTGRPLGRSRKAK